MYRNSGYDKWDLTQTEDSFNVTFAEGLNDLVYLTADSEETVNVLDPSKVYIIGGIVDRNRYKGLTFEKAKAIGIKTAKYFDLKIYAMV